MSEFQDVEKKIGNLIDVAFNESESLWYQKIADAAWVLIDGELQKNPIETKKYIVRHISISPYNVKDVIQKYQSENKEFREFDPLNPELRKLLRKEADVEFLPKINVADKNFSYLDSLNYVRNNVQMFGEDAFGAFGDYFVPEKNHKSDSIFYRDREDIAINYRLENDVWGYVTLAEREKGQKDFVHPNFKDFVSPSINFQPFTLDKKYGYKIIEKLYDEFQNV